MSREVIWIDDDAKGLLRPLGRMLRKRRLVLHTSSGVSDGADVLTKKSRADVRVALLVDVILPFSKQFGAMSHYLGIALAELAIDLGVEAIAFLSVVPPADVHDQVQRLRAHDGDNLNSLVQFLADGAGE